MVAPSSCLRGPARSGQGRGRSFFRSHLSLLALLFSAACAARAPAPPPDKLVLDRSSYEMLGGWREDRQAEALATFLASCNALEKRQGDATVGKGLLAAPAADWKAVCLQARAAMPTANPPPLPAPSPMPVGTLAPLAATPEQAPATIDDLFNSVAIPPDDAAARRFFEANFTPYAASNRGRHEGLFTGYYEPLLYGSHTRRDQYQTPVYAPPPDLVKGQSYFSHREIAEGALANRGLEIAWVDRPVDLFFLQIQGSGRIRFDSGEETRLAYAGQNGHGYVALGKVMKERNLLPPDGINFFTIRQWILDHPEEGRMLMWENPSYVFFKLEPPIGSGPKGAQGVPLTPERSLAVDKNFYPYGLPIYFETTIPYPAETPYRRLMVAQDTGGAIKGPVRGDVFFGHGERAEALAGNMKNRGQWSLLIPNAIAARLGAHAE